MEITDIAFRKALRDLLNTYSAESDSNTPDYILADYLIECLLTFGRTVRRREKRPRADDVDPDAQVALLKKKLEDAEKLSRERREEIRGMQEEIDRLRKVIEEKNEVLIRGSVEKIREIIGKLR